MSESPGAQGRFRPACDSSHSENHVPAGFAWKAARHPMSVMTPNEIQTSPAGSGRPAAAFNLVLGIWLFISPWVYGAYQNSNAWNSWVVGALIALFAIIRMSSPGGLPFFSWLNMLLGAW